MDWTKCIHRFVLFFGPVMKCSRCGASTIVSMGGESKPILPPTTITDDE